MVHKYISTIHTECYKRKVPGLFEPIVLLRVRARVRVRWGQN